MAASLKEKNMPTISANIYGGLQKWVNRASVSLRGRRNRNNSIVSAMSSYQRNNFGSLTKETGSAEPRFAPSHSRSRSNPITMSDTLLFEAEHQKIPQVVKQTKNAVLRTKPSLELSDDSSSRGSLNEARDLSVLNRRLSNTLSKSESNLIEKQRRSKSLSGASKSRQRKISQETAMSYDSNISELDINDAHKKSQSSQSLCKTNKRDKSHSVDLTRANKLEQFSSSTKSVEEMSKNIHTRLDMWVEKTKNFQQSSQSSFDSTSSSEDTFDDNKKIRPNDMKHFRDLQSALEELVSSCGRISAGNSIVIDNDKINDNKNNRKVSLKNSGAPFSKAIDIDCNLSQEEHRNAYKNQKCGSSTDSGSSRGKDHETKAEKREEICREEQYYELESSYDIIDGIIDERDQPHKSHSSKEDDIDIGLTKHNARGMNIITEDHASNQPQNTSTTKNISLPNLTMANGQTSDEDSSYAGPNSTDIPLISGETELSFENGEVLPKPKRSPKKHHAPSPPSNSGKGKTTTIAPAPVFDDEELTAFALQCVEASEHNSSELNDRKKNSLEREVRQHRSDSDEEKKTALALDYVYVLKNVKSSTHPKTIYDDKNLPQGAFSDDECYSRNNNRYIQSKRNSADSLDGLVIFDTAKDIAIDKYSDSKCHSSNEQEQENEKDTEKTDYRNGLRKFPSMPLFYVPNEGIRKSSRGKSLWRKLKSLPRATDKDTNRTTTTPKTKSHHTLNSNQTDPFYHGEKDHEFISKMRPKSNSLAISPKERISRRRSLELGKLRPHASLPSFIVDPPIKDDKEKIDYTNVVNSSKPPDESQC